MSTSSSTPSAPGATWASDVSPGRSRSGRPCPWRSAGDRFGSTAPAPPREGTARPISRRVSATSNARNVTWRCWKRRRTGGRRVPVRPHRTYAQHARLPSPDRLRGPFSRRGGGRRPAVPRLFRRRTRHRRPVDAWRYRCRNRSWTKTHPTSLPGRGRSAAPRGRGRTGPVARREGCPLLYRRRVLRDFRRATAGDVSSGHRPRTAGHPRPGLRSSPVLSSPWPPSPPRAGNPMAAIRFIESTGTASGATPIGMSGYAFR